MHLPTYDVQFDEQDANLPSSVDIPVYNYALDHWFPADTPHRFNVVVMTTCCKSKEASSRDPLNVIEEFH